MVDAEDSGHLVFAKSSRMLVCLKLAVRLLLPHHQKAAEEALHLLHLQWLPPVVPPVASPVEPPVAPPVDPPVAPPVEPPVAPPVESPVAPPVEPPVAPPAAPKTEALATPVPESSEEDLMPTAPEPTAPMPTAVMPTAPEPTVSPPVAPPEAAPVVPHVTPTAPKPEGFGLVGCFSGKNMVNVENKGPTRYGRCSDW